jgi:UDP-glucose:glycoprotein glucosyltransferase
LAILFKRSSTPNKDDLIKKAIVYSLTNLDAKKSVSLVKKLVKEKTFKELKTGEKKLQDLNLAELSDPSELVKVENIDLEPIIKQNEEFFRDQTPFKDSDQTGLIANGWVIGPFDEDEQFIDSDFSLLENFILKTGLKQTKQLIAKWNSASKIAELDDKAIMINSILGKYTSTDKRTKVPVFTSGVVNIKPRRENAPFYDMVVILDPLTRNAQKISTILKVLTQSTNLNLVIYFNCKDKLSAPPLKSFYRYVLESEIQFNPKGTF